MFEWMLKSFPALRGRWTGQNFSSSRQNFHRLRAQKRRLKKATGLKKGDSFNPDAQRPKSLRSGERAAPVRNRDGRGEPIQRRVSAGERDQKQTSLLFCCKELL